jgi:hypothetical protein
MSRGRSIGVHETAEDLIQVRCGAIQAATGTGVSHTTHRNRDDQDDAYCDEGPEQHGISPRSRSGVPP